ncbi:MAG TPA: hypothetical protein ENG81_00905 [Candidatus Bathyarchaeota archaeon]|nr:hypothetical protein [Candidatus Bathyarchaeota archaeon]
MVGSKGVVDLYRKAHLFYKEKLFFSPGNTGFKVFNLNGVKVGVLICFDLCFPEAARIPALKGADMIFIHPI